jgi:hypothetical protein
MYEMVSILFNDIKSHTMRVSSISIVVFLALLISCNGPANRDSSPADDNLSGDPSAEAVMYHGGEIITMEGDEPSYAEAVVVRSGKIAFVGSKDEAMKVAGDGHQMVDLAGRTLVPGFVDGHAHFHGFGAQAVTANLLANPDGVCDDIPSLIRILKEWHEKNGTDKTQGWNGI